MSSHVRYQLYKATQIIPFNMKGSVAKILRFSLRSNFIEHSLVLIILLCLLFIALRSLCS